MHRRDLVEERRIFYGDGVNLTSSLIPLFQLKEPEQGKVGAKPYHQV